MEPRIIHYSHCRKISLKLPKSPCLSLRRVLQTYILEKLALFIEMQKKLPSLFAETGPFVDTPLTCILSNSQTCYHLMVFPSINNPVVLVRYQNFVFCFHFITKNCLLRFFLQPLSSLLILIRTYL